MENQNVSRIISRFGQLFRITGLLNLLQQEYIALNYQTVIFFIICLIGSVLILL